MTRQASLFNEPRGFSGPSTPAPSRVASDPRVHLCATCGKEGAPCGVHTAWFCVGCAPADFWPGRRA